MKTEQEKTEHEILKSYSLWMKGKNTSEGKVLELFEIYTID